MARFLRERECRDRTGLPRSTRYELIAKGEFPRPVRIGRRAVAWLDEEVEEWMQRRVAERDGEAA